MDAGYRCADPGRAVREDDQQHVEVGSRGAYLMGLTNYGNYSVEDTVDFTVYIPKTDRHFTTSLAVVPLQLMGYYVSLQEVWTLISRENLAKSVTVGIICKQYGLK